MSSVESVLTSRNASSSDMVALLQRQHDAKLDVVVPARDLRMTDGDLHIEGIGEPTITLDGCHPGSRGIPPHLDLRRWHRRQARYSLAVPAPDARRTRRAAGSQRQHLAG